MSLITRSANQIQIGRNITAVRLVPKAKEKPIALRRIGTDKLISLVFVCARPAEVVIELIGAPMLHSVESENALGVEVRSEGWSVDCQVVRGWRGEW